MSTEDSQAGLRPRREIIYPGDLVNTFFMGERKENGVVIKVGYDGWCYFAEVLFDRRILWFPIDGVEKVSSSAQR